MAHRAPAGIAERRAWLLGSAPVVDELATGLRLAGLAVTTTGGAARAGVEGGLGRATAAPGQVDTAVWAWTPPGLAATADLVDLDAATWRDLVAGTLRRYVGFLQAAERQLHDRGGRVVVLVPTVALGGAAGLVAWATVADSQRALAKSAARVWGASAITVNCVAVPAALLAGAPGPHGRPDLQRPALPDPDLRHDVAGVVAALCGDAMSAVTGTTLGVDGGRWMPS
jgi:3-oxoacyl-[acyl-carrier protein] reductase